jgi:hypothetical protein
MSYNLETRVERLERQRPANPYEHMTDEELEARVAALDAELSQRSGFYTKGMEMVELRQWIEVEERGDPKAANALLEQFRRKYGPPASKVSP